MDSIRQTRNNRGFRVDEFEDHYGVKCSIQKSSLATDDCIWIGCNEIGLKVFLTDVGWHEVDLATIYPQMESVVANTRMHLSRDHVAALLPTLQHFVETGELPEIGE